MKRKIILSAIASLFLVGAGCLSVSSTAPVNLGIFRSPDKGENWTEINIFPTAQGMKSLATVKVYRIFSDPNDVNALYMATRGQGLYYSYDKGDSWQTVPFFQGKFVYGVAVDPTDKCTIFAIDGVATYRTNDCSRTWTQVNYSQSGSKLVSVAVDYGNRNVVFTAIENGTILQSLNGGTSWRAIKNFNLTLRDLVTDPKVPGRVFVASANRGISRSDDNGENWVDVTSDLTKFTEGVTFFRLVLDPSTKDSLYWLSKYGIFHSTNAGDSWSEIKLVTSPGTVNIYNLAVNPKNPKELFYTGTTFTSTGANSITGVSTQVASSKLYKSLDGGSTWFNRKLPSAAIPVSLFVHPDLVNLLYIAFTSAQ
ncbi:MAG: hypothetical protein WC725_02160 [Patescibacteria group bacterium]|jgi:photosystem II stability/assembly factor-like uncharacterized protein